MEIFHYLNILKITLLIEISLKNPEKNHKASYSDLTYVAGLALVALRRMRDLLLS